MDITISPAELAAEEASALLSVVRSSCFVRSRPELLEWLQHEIHTAIPHTVVLAAWGDFRTGAISVDVCADGGRTPFLIDEEGLGQFLLGAFEAWVAGGEDPTPIDPAAVLPATGWMGASRRHGLIHGMKDRRGRYDCVYLLIGGSELASPRVRNLVRLVLPSIDAAFRQASDVSPAQPSARPVQPILTRRNAPCQDSGKLSAREREVMEWVRMGKTNSEIAMIMNLSTFTVKNHMRRIYQKLDVMNRAQAVGRLGAASPM